MELAITVLSAAAAVLVILLVATVLLVASLRRRAESLRGELEAERSRGRSRSTRYGQTMEQFMPWAANYPYDTSRFRFIGSPIDGVQFEDDRVILMEFKTAGSKLSQAQRRIRDLVQRDKVDFEEFRLS